MRSFLIDTTNAHPVPVSSAPAAIKSNRDQFTPGMNRIATGKIDTVADTLVRSPMKLSATPAATGMPPPLPLRAKRWRKAPLQTKRWLMQLVLQIGQLGMHHGDRRFDLR